MFSARQHRWRIFNERDGELTAAVSSNRDDDGHASNSACKSSSRDDSEGDDAKSISKRIKTSLMSAINRIIVRPGSTSNLASESSADDNERINDE